MQALTKLISIAIVLVAAMAVGCPLAATAATKTICVGIVVDARSLDGPVSADCATVRDGSTGYDVLRAAGHTVEFRRDGLICTIDDRPADGCAGTDASHFWAYFHRAAGSSNWQYSNEGSTTYRPDNNETEGWVWRDGNDAKPANVPYRTICPQVSSPSPSPSIHRSPTSSPTEQPTRPASGAAAAAATPPPHDRSARHERQRTKETSTASPVVDSPSLAATPIASRSPRIAVSSVGSDGSSSPPYGLIAGAVVVVGLGGVAAVRWRRRGVD